MQRCKCRINIISVQCEGGKEKIVNKLDVGMHDIKSLDDFKKEIESIKNDYPKYYHDGGTVIVIRPQTLQRLIQMESWMMQNTETDKRHICTRVFVHDKDDSSFRWPVFLQGLDVQDEEKRKAMVQACKEISVSRMHGSGHDCYADDSDVCIYRGVEDDNWIRDTILLCKLEEMYGINERTYRLFLDFDAISKWEG